MVAKHNRILHKFGHVQDLTTAQAKQDAYVMVERKMLKDLRILLRALQGSKDLKRTSMLRVGRVNGRR